MKIELESQQEAGPIEIDEATHAALDEAEAAIARGEVVTLEQSRINARERYKEWQKIQKVVAKAA